jgi:hypothetical protein
VRVSPGSLLVIVRAGPFTRAQREERHVVDHVPQRLVARMAKLDDTRLLAASLRHREGAGLPLRPSRPGRQLFGDDVVGVHRHDVARPGVEAAAGRFQMASPSQIGWHGP